MKLVFNGSIEEIQSKLTSVAGNWDISQPNKKVLRSEGFILNWFPSTGTVGFQGKEEGREYFEDRIKSLLYPQEFTTPLQPKLPPVTSTAPLDENILRDDSDEHRFLEGKFDNSEIIIGIVASVGTESARIVESLTSRLQRFGYSAYEIKVSSLLPATGDIPEYDRIKSLMQAGDDLRKRTGNNAILAYGAAKLIQNKRESARSQIKKAYIINSLKHPDEVEVLRKMYGQGFYLFGIHADSKRRSKHLMEDKGVSLTQANELIGIDEDEKLDYGQRTRDTYHLSDFFISFGKNADHLKNTIQRFLDLMFSHPYRNPTFDEFAMFMAFSSSVRSGDLSRQVGAVVAKEQQILATGANETPASGGGLYWAELNPEDGTVIDFPDGKDYTRSEDSNKAEQSAIIQDILNCVISETSLESGNIDKINRILQSSRIRDLTEFGRVVHAEMEALLSCGRGGINTIGTTLYCTTFPCHNCAKHIIAAGVNRVVYVEPYPKSKALDFHSDSIELVSQAEDDTQVVKFEPFTGVGARRFLDFFSMNLGLGNKLKRKDKSGKIIDWEIAKSPLRVPLLPKSYIDVEKSAVKFFDKN